MGRSKDFERYLQILRNPTVALSFYIFPNLGIFPDYMVHIMDKEDNKREKRFGRIRRDLVKDKEGCQGS